MAELIENARPGVLVSLEGVDGCGKTTQAELLELALVESGRSCLRLREPGGTIISEQVRRILLDPANERLCDEAELLLYEAARAQLVREVIEPALAEGIVVICDRFYDSSFAYQSSARGLDEDMVRKANELGSCGVKPNRTVVLDIDPREAYVRAVDRGADRMESEGLRFQQLVRSGYLRASDLEPERIRLVDARGDVPTVFSRLVTALSDVIPELSSLDALAFISAQADVERAFAEVTAAVAANAEIRASVLAHEEQIEAEERAARAAAEQAEAQAEAEAAAAEEARQQEAARLAAEAEAEAQAREAEEAARQAALAAAREAEEAAERARAEAAARVAAEEAELFAQVEAAVAREAARMSTLNPTEFAREERAAERDALSSLDRIVPPIGFDE